MGPLEPRTQLADISPSATCFWFPCYFLISQEVRSCCLTPVLLCMDLPQSLCLPSFDGLHPRNQELK